MSRPTKLLANASDEPIIEWVKVEGEEQSFVIDPGQHVEVPVSDDEYAEIQEKERNAPAAILDMIRVERDGLLKASDWTQSGDVPKETRDLWAPYRKALRDFPNQPGFDPLDPPEWPVAPDATE